MHDSSHFLSYDQRADTATTFHLRTQIVGKIKMTLSPRQNHSRHAALYVTPYGITTGHIPYQDSGFSLSFDLIHHQFILDHKDHDTHKFELVPMTVATFYREVMQLLTQCDIHVKIYPRPNEIPDNTRFDQDTTHDSYDTTHIEKFLTSLQHAHDQLTHFRSNFLGKCSPVHFFRGSFDLAVTRFSGRTAPVFDSKVPNMPTAVMQEAYSHEVSSAGFRRGNTQAPDPFFYSYVYPSYEKFSSYPIQPSTASWSDDLGEFILPYHSALESSDPGQTIQIFLESTYQAATESGDRPAGLLSTHS